MTQSKDKDEYTLDLTNIDGTMDTITSTDSSISSIGDIWSDTNSIDTTYTVDSSWSNISDYIIDTDTIDLSNITFDRVMFEDDMPDPQEIKRMCEEYPALEKVYENFKTVYKMVEQDWRGKQKDDELPF